MQKESEGEKSTFTISEMKSEKKLLCVSNLEQQQRSFPNSKKGSVKLNLEIQGQMFGGINRFYSNKN